MTHKKSSVLLAAAMSLTAFSYAQKGGKPPNGWHLQDQKTSGYYGISLDKAYEFVKGKKSNTVIVAVIDSGVDTLHEDLKPVLWVNKKEIPGNGIDDDGNGYVDDVHGWNFLGGRDGRNVNKDSYEAARVYHNYKQRFEKLTDASGLSKEDKYLYEMWKRSEKEVSQDQNPAQLAQLKTIAIKLKEGDSIIVAELKKAEYNARDLVSYKSTNPSAIATKAIMMNISQANGDSSITNKMILGQLEGELSKAEAADTPPQNYRGDIVKDNENDINDKFYGNNDIMAGTPFHGTHVSGIIAAVRKNGKGVDGIADNVRIMTLRAVPDGDEHDKDIALAIRYAADNGARIINMSFGKSFSPQKSWIDDAVQYAESKGVLLVHAAGNDAKDLDHDYNFPNPTFLKNDQRAPNWLTIGASGDPKNGGLSAGFSNYGKNEVDVFAPGVDIYSSIPGGNTYGNASGTSMASPVTAGVAAFLLEYYPTLTPEQIKYVLEKSSVAPSIKAEKPGTEEEISFAELSKNGGMVNAFEAAKLAAQITGKKNPEPVKTKMKVKETKKA